MIACPGSARRVLASVRCLPQLSYSAPRPARNYLSSIRYGAYRLHQRQRVEPPAQHALGIGVSHPLADERRIHAAVIGRIFEIAVLEVGETRQCAVLATLDGLADHEGGTGRAVIRALAGVFFHA